MGWRDDESIVKQDCVGDYFVSTVRNICNTGTEADPLWFETMIFELDLCGHVNTSGIYQKEVATLAEAEAEHANVCAAIERGEVPHCDQAPVNFTEIGMLMGRLFQDQEAANDGR